VRLSLKFLLPFLLALLLSSSSVALKAQSTATGNQRATSKPYTGDLSIFEYPDRDQKLQVNRVMDILGLKPGSTVADIGAGSGWFTVRAAKRVGPSGMVYAVDINPAAISYINDRAKREHLENIRAIQGREDDPLLPDNSVDSVLLLKTYHEVAQPILLLEKLRRALKPGALVGVIDRDGKGDDHGVDRKVVVEEARAAGFRLVSTYDFVKPDREDYFLVLQLVQ
jgi:ubiquinone/menaquinone biosynthesis C-methylase UbiE